MFRFLFTSVLVLFTCNSTMALECLNENFQFRKNQQEIDYRIYTSNREIKLMSYNVQNLFDTNQDKGKMDWEFLPRNYPGKAQACARVKKHYRQKCLESNWTLEKYKLKLLKIREAIEMAGPLPDILALQEIENEKVVGDLAKLLGFRKFVVTNSPDQRGIDVALLFNEDHFKYVDHHQVVMTGGVFANKPTRNILGVNFQPMGSSNHFGIYVNHWPSQAAPPETRVSVAYQLRKFIETNRRRFGSSYHVIATGDFNTVDEDFPNPISHVIETPAWPEHLVDLQRVINKNFVKLRVLLPPGSYFYKKTNSWNRFDRFLLSQNFFSSGGLFANLGNFRIIATKNMGQCFFDSLFAANYSYGNHVFGIPKKYNHNARGLEDAGFSDHFPIVMSFSY
ncbi:MAG: hypothetical protein VX583_12790 [Bdellovibrionota bacterium]|nr:hypothetical protein [Pseudobdellovibrionaceae bacterium]